MQDREGHAACSRAEVTHVAADPGPARKENFKFARPSGAILTHVLSFPACWCNA